MTQDDKVALSTAALLLCALLMQFLQPADAVAQESAPSATMTDQRAHFPSLGQQLPALLSGSGRFSAIDPANQVTCGATSVAGRVISRSLIYMRENFDCGGFRGHGMLVNVELADQIGRAHV